MTSHRWRFSGLLLVVALLALSAPASGDSILHDRWAAVVRMEHAYQGSGGLNYWESPEFKSFCELGDQALPFLESVFATSPDVRERALAIHLYSVISGDPGRIWNLFRNNRKDNDHLVESIVIHLLQFYDDREYVSFCRERLSSGSRSWEALSTMAWKRQYVSWEEMLSHFRGSGEAWALVVIGELGDKKALPSLRELSSSGDKGVAAAALIGLGLLRDTEALDQLYEMFREQREVHLYHGFYVAGAILEGAQTKPLMEQLVRDAENNEHCLAVLTRIEERNTGVPLKDFCSLWNCYREDPRAKKAALSRARDWWGSASTNWSTPSKRIVVEMHHPYIGDPPDDVLWIDYTENLH